VARERTRCASCDAKIEIKSFCPRCGYPTKFASHEERILWELGQWEDSRPGLSAGATDTYAPPAAACIGAPDRFSSRTATAVATRPEPIYRPPSVQPVEQPRRPAESRPAAAASSDTTRSGNGSAGLSEGSVLVEHAKAPTMERPLIIRRISQRAKRAVTRPEAPVERPAPSAAPATDAKSRRAAKPLAAPAPANLAPGRDEPAPSKPRPTTAPLQATPAPAPAAPARERAPKPPKAPRAAKPPKPERERATREERRARKRQRAFERAKRRANSLELYEGESVSLSLDGWARFQRAAVVVTRYRVVLISRWLKRVHWIPLEEVTRASLRWRGSWVLNVEGSVETITFQKHHRGMLASFHQMLHAEVREARLPGGRRHHPDVIQDWCDRSTRMWDSHVGRIRLWIHRHPVISLGFVALLVPAAYFLTPR
jgi:hypothetical protein